MKRKLTGDEIYTQLIARDIDRDLQELRPGGRRLVESLRRRVESLTEQVATVTQQYATAVLERDASRARVAELERDIQRIARGEIYHNGHGFWIDKTGRGHGTLYAALAAGEE